MKIYCCGRANEKPTLLEELNESIINNLKSLVKEEQEKK